VPEPYVGEIRMFAGNYAPAGWNLCDGSQLQIAGNEVLFNLIGTTYGGDGQTKFAVPDMRGRLPVHMGNGFTVGQTGGVEMVTLTLQQIPTHNHTLVASQSIATQQSPSGNLLAQSTLAQMYIQDVADTPLAADSIPLIPNEIDPHTNFQPYLCVNFIISLFGIFPPHS
jgi:microcystin-dependent protein